MTNEILQAYRAGSEIGGTFQRIDEAMHNRAVQEKMDEILKATNERGGDITMLDPNQYSDRIGLEAMGKVTAQLANTEAYKVRIMQNNAAQARNRFSTFQQYMTDIDSAIKEGDQQRTLGLMSNMAAQSGTPYRFSPTEDGQVRVSFVTPEGISDKGTMSMIEAYNMLRPYATNQDRFIRDSVMYGMATAEDNAMVMQDPRRWRTAVDANGNQYTLVPQRIMKNGQLVPGFLVAGPGGQRNMTMDEVMQSGLNMAFPSRSRRLGTGLSGGGVNARGQGLGAPSQGGGVQVSESAWKDARKAFSDFATQVDDMGNKVLNYDTLEALELAAPYFQGDSLKTIQAYRRARSAYDNALGADKEQAALVEKMTPEQRQRAFLNFFYRQIVGGGRSGGSTGMLVPGNIDLSNRPVVKNPDGSVSTVRSMSINIDGKEVLIPTVSDDGRLLSEDEAIEMFRRTGRHLGVFDTPENATAYAKKLHEDQESMYASSRRSGSARPDVQPWMKEFDKKFLHPEPETGGNAQRQDQKSSQQRIPFTLSLH